MGFPNVRMRRLRENPVVRDMVRETGLGLSDLIMPLFVVEGGEYKEEIKSMPGQFRYSVKGLVDECKRIFDIGIHSVLLFGIPEQKDGSGSEAWNDNGIVQKAMQALKKELPQMLIVSDVCLCEYTSHGHCGVISESRILNDPTLELLAKISVSHARAGADIIAPSDMMDGRIKAIRDSLDSSGFSHIPIMSYAAKYSSAFYGPFREAAESAPQFGDRKSYQMDPANKRQAMREIELDIMEGADIVMVKPAMTYMDIIHEARNRFDLPIAAYNVSGEYSLIKAAAEKGWIDEQKIVLETLLSIKRAGADIILSYYAAQVADWQKASPVL